LSGSQPGRHSKIKYNIEYLNFPDNQQALVLAEKDDDHGILLVGRGVGNASYFGGCGASTVETEK
jgi:hypothetical protein